MVVQRARAATESSAVGVGEGRARSTEWERFCVAGRGVERGVTSGEGNRREEEEELVDEEEEEEGVVRYREVISLVRGRRGRAALSFSEGKRGGRTGSRGAAVAATMLMISRHRSRCFKAISCCDLVALSHRRSSGTLARREE